MRYNYIRGATKAEDGYDRPACYQVFRDEYRPGWDHAAWYIRENEVRPLHELLGSLLADSSPAVSLRDSVLSLQGWLRRAAAEVNDYGTEGNEDLYDALERGTDQLGSLLDVLDHYLKPQEG